MICAAVLAGGRSSRMGRDKATLVVGGERLVDRVARAAAGALREAGEAAPRVLVSGAVEGYECVPDDAAGLGPVAGIAAVLERLLAATPPARAVLLVPVDLPCVTAAALLPLARAARPTHFEGNALPALLRCDEPTRATVRAVLASAGRERSVTRLLALLGAEALPLDAAGAAALANANTPEELRDALAADGARASPDGTAAGGGEP